MFLLTSAAGAGGGQCLSLFSYKNVETQKQTVLSLLEKAQSKKQKDEFSPAEVQFVQEIEAFLTRNGVDFEYTTANKDKPIRIVASANSKLNLLAKQMLDDYNTFIVFSVTDALRTSNLAFVDSQVIDGRLNLFFGISIDHLLSLGEINFRRDLIFLHELRHLRFYFDIMSKLESPFYGYIESTKGQIPDKINPKARDYSDMLSFEEMKTYHAEIKQSLEALKQDESLKERRETIEYLEDRLRVLSILTQRIQQSINGAIKAIGSQKAEITFFESVGTVYAKITQNTLKNTKWYLEIPLIKSQGTADLNNYEYLFDQLNWTLHTADVLLIQTQKANKLFRQIKKTAPELDKNLIDEIQIELNPSDLETLPLLI